MCMSSGSSATQAATAQAEQQQAAITKNVNAINAAFAGRQAQYTSYLNALNQSYQQQLNLQQAQASRGLKFSLARNGMTGSSVAADQGAELQREMGQGEVTAAEQAQAKLAALQSSDQAEQQQLISEAASGANVGNVGQEMSTALQSNIQNAQTNLGPNTLGNVFGGITTDITNANTAAANRIGLRAAGGYANAFSQTPTSNQGF